MHKQSIDAFSYVLTMTLYTSEIALVLLITFSLKETLIAQTLRKPQESTSTTQGLVSDAEPSINSRDTLVEPDIEEMILDTSITQKSLNKFKANDNLQSNIDILQKLQRLEEKERLSMKRQSKEMIQRYSNHLTNNYK